MKTETITNVVAAATALHDLFEKASTPPFDKSTNSALHEIVWGSKMGEYLAALNCVRSLENEYFENTLEAIDKARVKEFYRQQIQMCKMLCPYPDCGLYDGDSKSIFVPAIEKLAERCKGKTGFAAWIENDEEKKDWEVSAQQTQCDFVNKVKALVNWWKKIEPSLELCPLTQYPNANTERAREYYAKAIEAGMMIETSRGFKWLLPDGRGNKAALAYFIGRVYTDNYTPDKELEALFGESRLGQARRSSATPFAGKIDKLFNDEQ